MALTVEADAADVLEELLAPGQVHVGADAGALRTQVPLHVVEGVGHGVHGVDHELDLALLLVLGVDADALLTWRDGTETSGIHFETDLSPKFPSG